MYAIQFYHRVMDSKYADGMVNSVESKPKYQCENLGSHYGYVTICVHHYYKGHLCLRRVFSLITKI